jgi:hypothetical protein
MEDIDKQLASSSSGFMDQLVSDAEEPPNTESVGVQPKLAIGQVGDPYEVEADQVADRVMKMPEPIEEQSSKNQGEVVQRQPVALSINRLVQRQQIQAQAVEQKWAEADGMGQEQINLAVQRKCSKCQEEEEQEKGIQRKETAPESGMLQAKANSSLESRLAANAGGGSALPDDVRSFMEPRFGADFNSVRVHTDSQAVQMSQELGAQAFTYGNDIYYGQGKSPGNNDLTAHELTHTIQQMGAVQVQRQSNSNPILGTDMDDPLIGTEGNDTIFGLKGNDLIEGKEGKDVIYGGKGNDQLKGGEVNDALYGNQDDDQIFGDLGNDKLYGGKGNDILQGGAGDDELFGGKGNNQLFGGEGGDIFVFNAQDTGYHVVEDFQVGEDVIQLEGFPFYNFDELKKNFAKDKGSSVELSFPQENLTFLLKNITIIQLTPSNFRFSGGSDPRMERSVGIAQRPEQPPQQSFCLLSDGSTGSCGQLTSELLEKLRKNPGGFYTIASDQVNPDFKWIRGLDNDPSLVAQMHINSTGLPPNGNYYLGLQQNILKSDFAGGIKFDDPRQAPFVVDIEKIKFEMRATLCPRLNTPVVARATYYFNFFNPNPNNTNPPTGEGNEIAFDILQYVPQGFENPTEPQGNQNPTAPQDVKPPIARGGIKNQVTDLGDDDLTKKDTWQIPPDYWLQDEKLDFSAKNSQGQSVTQFKCNNDINQEEWLTVEIPVANIIAQMIAEGKTNPNIQNSVKENVVQGAKYTGGTIGGLEIFGQGEGTLQIKNHILIMKQK